MRIAALSFVLATSLAAQDKVHHLVEVRTTGPAQLQQLLAMDLDLASCTTPLPAQRRVEIIATDADLLRLRQNGFQPVVRIRHLEAHHAAQAAQFPTSDDLVPPVGQGAMGGHYTLAQMVAILDAMHAANPAICAAKVSIGNSIENRPIWMVKISDNVGTDESEPEVLYDAVHHAREPLSMTTTLLFMDWLITNYGTDPLATFLVDHRELYFVPCLNPDGYEYNYLTNPGGGGMWRKNRRDNGNSTFGVDINRNYPAGWSAPNGGNSTSTSSETYRGTAPLSEPETQAIEGFAQSRQFVQVFSTHTYQDILLRPYGWQTTPPVNDAAYALLGGWLTVENGLDHGQISTHLYIAAGSAVDQHHDARGSYAWTAELGRSNEGGFWPSGPTIVDIATRNQPMFRKIALSAGPALGFDNVVVSEAPGGNNNQVVEPGETGLVQFAVRNHGVQALASAVVVTLTAQSTGIAIGNGSTGLPGIAALSSVPAPVALSFTVPVGFSGPLAALQLAMTGDGRTTTHAVVVQLQPSRLLVDDDCEQDRGFTRGAVGTATTGLWERSTPIATQNGATPIQPGTQTTPGGTRCWVTDGRAGSGAGTYDVDGGYTDLLSPVLDLQHAQLAELQFDLWYAESTSDDAMQVAVSRDGGANWSTVLTRTTSTGAWLPVTVPLEAPLTAQMRVRVRAQDLNPSLVECLIDGVKLRAVVGQGAVTLFGSGRIGTTVRVGLNVPAGAFAVPLVAPNTAPPITFPGVQGSLLLELASTVALNPLPGGASGDVAFDVPVPNNPALIGLTFHCQGAWQAAGGIGLGGNVQSVTLQ